MRCFHQATAVDPTARWPGGASPRSLDYAFSALHSALTRRDGAESVERALISALAVRYPANVPDLASAAWNDSYATAMREVYHDRADVAALFAEALVNRTPWRLWDVKTGTSAEGADTLEAIAVLERAMMRPDGSRHPGLLRMYLHLMEMSSRPKRALPAADHLRDLVPDAGHLVHMPTHIDILCGHYAKVVAYNSRAIAADRKFLAREGPVNFYTLYRCHNYHFKTYGAMFLGQFAPALEAADEMIATLAEELLRVEVPPMADWLEGFIPM